MPLPLMGREAKALTGAGWRLGRGGVHRPGRPARPTQNPVSPRARCRHRLGQHGAHLELRLRRRTENSKRRRNPSLPPPILHCHLPTNVNTHPHSTPSSSPNPPSTRGPTATPPRKSSSKPSTSPPSTPPSKPSSRSTRPAAQQVWSSTPATACRTPCPSTRASRCPTASGASTWPGAT
jgi:hypothetical protein